RRSCKVTLTSKGVKCVDTALNDHVENMDKMLNVLTKKEQDQLADLLRKVLIYEENE
ncbi:MarR family transcriptional regulator, partial [Vibrio sp. V10_P2A27P122]